jgi:phosphoglycolate phosphatase
MIQKKAGFITRNLIFDVDGTLWDTTEIVARAWNRALAESGEFPANLTADIL